MPASRSTTSSARSSPTTDYSPASRLNHHEILERCRRAIGSQAVLSFGDVVVDGAGDEHVVHIRMQLVADHGEPELVVPPGRRRERHGFEHRDSPVDHLAYLEL